jgi:hypothetical protein
MSFTVDPRPFATFGFTLPIPVPIFDSVLDGNFGSPKQDWRSLVPCYPGPSSNTVEIIFHNTANPATQAANRVYIRVLDGQPMGVDNSASTEGSWIPDYVVDGLGNPPNSLIVMPGEKLRLFIGPEGNRESLASTVFVPPPTVVPSPTPGLFSYVTPPFPHWDTTTAGLVQLPQFFPTIPNPHTFDPADSGLATFPRLVIGMRVDPRWTAPASKIPVVTTTTQMVVTYINGRGYSGQSQT